MANMKTNDIPEFLFLIRDMQSAEHLSPEEIQSITMKRAAWIDHLRRTANIVEGRPLEHGSTLISKGEGEIVATRLLTEATQRITGLLLLRVENIVEAEKLAKSFPRLDLDSTIEIHTVARNEC